MPEPSEKKVLNKKPIDKEALRKLIDQENEDHKKIREEDEKRKSTENGEGAIISREQAQLRWFLNKLILLSKEPVTFYGNYDEYICFPTKLLGERPDLFSITIGGEYPISESDIIKDEQYDQCYCYPMLEKIKRDIYKLENKNQHFNAEKFDWISEDSGHYFGFYAILIDCYHTPLLEAYLRFMDDGKTESNTNANFNNNIIWKKTKKKQLQLPNIPNDLKWSDITIRFLNGDEAQVTAKGSVFHSNYELMGFRDEKTKNPNRQWELLKLLSHKNGFLNWDNNRELEIKAVNRIKKQKQELSEKLSLYFHTIKDSPFFDYKEEGGYKIKIQLIPEQDMGDR